MKLVEGLVFKCNDIDVAIVDHSGNRFVAIRTKSTYPFWMSSGGYVHYELDGVLVGRWSLLNNPFDDDDSVESFLCGLSLGSGMKPITEDYLNFLLKRTELIKHHSGRYILYENTVESEKYYDMKLSTGLPAKPITRRKTKNLKVGTRKALH